MSADAPYTILFTDDAKLEISSLDGSIKKQLRNVLEKKLAIAPTEYGNTLRGILTGFWSHHFASHRVIYRIYNEKRLVVVCAVGLRQGVHKSDVYKRLEAIAKTGRLAEKIKDVLQRLDADRKTPEPLAP